MRLMTSVVWLAVLISVIVTNACGGRSGMIWDGGADTDADSDSDADTDADTDGDTDGDSDSDSDSDTDVDADTDADSDSDSDSDGDTDVDSDSDTDVDSDSDGDTDTEEPLYDATRDFSTDANPDGVWTFGYVTSIGGALTVFPSFDPETNRWYDIDNVSLNCPCAWKNDGTSTQYGAQPGELSIHPGGLGELTFVRWTAPIAGTFVVHVQFFVGDLGETDAYVLQESSILFYDDTTDDDPAHDFTVTVAPGDNVDALVGPIDDFGGDNTPVEFIIDAP